MQPSLDGISDPINFMAQLGLSYVPFKIHVRVHQKAVKDDTTWFMLCHKELSLDHVLEQIVNRLLLTSVSQMHL